MTPIDLLYDDDCPNVEAAREALREALERLGMPPRWRELRGGADDLPDYARGFGSPSVFVDGRDVSGVAAGEGRCCRVYLDEEGARRGAPPVELIEAALRGALADGTKKGDAA